MSSGSAIEVYGFKLGAAYADAVKAAQGAFQLRENGSEAHTGSGTIDGMQATLQLEGKDGRLVDVQLRLMLSQGDADMATGVPYGKLKGSLGEPATKSADVMQWKPAGFTVDLYRQTTYARGQDTPNVEYEIRGRASKSASKAAGSGSTESEQDRKAEEAAEQGTP